MAPLRAISLDLDDTLWPIEPCIEAAERELLQWLDARVPGFAQRVGVAGLRRCRDEVGREWLDRAHDLSALRQESIRRALLESGADPALASSAFEAFIAARQQVVWYDDAAPALARLAQRFRLFAVSNGNADLNRTGAARWLSGGVNAGEVGVGKPDARIFHSACSRLGLAPHEVLHVGDDPDKDVMGARRAGLPAVWLYRQDSVHGAGACEPQLVVTDLLQLAEALGA